jgi:hypothetical protein
MRFSLLLAENSPMGLLKEKSSYRPTRLESASAWIVTLASAAVLLWTVLR